MGVVTESIQGRDNRAIIGWGLALVKGARKWGGRVLCTRGGSLQQLSATPPRVREVHAWQVGEGPQKLLFWRKAWRVSRGLVETPWFSPQSMGQRGSSCLDPKHSQFTAPSLASCNSVQSRNLKTGSRAREVCDSKHKCSISSLQVTPLKVLLPSSITRQPGTLGRAFCPFSTPRSQFFQLCPQTCGHHCIGEECGNPCSEVSSASKGD